MQGVIVYREAEIEKNRFFVDRCTEVLGRHDISLKLTTAEEIYSALGRGNINKPDIKFAVNRSRNPEIAGIFETAGIRCFNNRALAKAGNDKLECYLSLSDEIDMMPTYTVDCYGKLHQKGGSATEPFFPLVVKNRYGKGGTEVYRMDGMDELTEFLGPVRAEDYICQSMCSNPGRDLRVYVIGDKVAAAVLRESDGDFRSNFGLGGRASLAEPTEAELEIVRKVLERYHVDYAGIDMIYDNEKPVLNEIEDGAGARMVYEASDIDMIGCFAEYVASEMSKEDTAG